MPPEPQLAPGDRLSALPDGLLHAVLSFLPGPQAVRTCVLSRRWKDLWRTAPCINIDMGDFGITASAGSDFMQKWSKFEDFTTNLLLFRSAVSLDQFRLYYCVSGHCLRDVDRWVRRGIKYCPQELEVLVMGSIHCPFPHLGESSFRLRRLHLFRVSLDRRFSEQIRSGCPNLEELELRCCVLNFQEITSHTLKRLFLHNSCSATRYRFIITAPSLVYFAVNVGYGCYSNGISVHVTDSLLKASIYLFCYRKTFSLKNQRSLLLDLCNVPDLELGGFQTKAILDEELDKLPMFCNLQTLWLARCFYDKCDLYDKLEALGSFLQNAPCLNKLTLKRCMFRVDPEMEGKIVRRSLCLPNQCRKTFQCQNLKLVEVIYEADHDNQLIELLWGIGRILPHSTVKLTNDLVD